MQCVRICGKCTDKEKLLSREWKADNYHDSYSKSLLQPSWPRHLEDEINLEMENWYIFMMSKVGWISYFQCLGLFYTPHLPVNLPCRCLTLSSHVWFTVSWSEACLDYEDALPFRLRHQETSLCVLHSSAIHHLSVSQKYLVLSTTGAKKTMYQINSLNLTFQTNFHPVCLHVKMFVN